MSGLGSTAVFGSLSTLRETVVSSAAAEEARDSLAESERRYYLLVLPTKIALSGSVSRPTRARVSLRVGTASTRHNELSL